MAVVDATAKARALYDARRSRVPIPPFTDEDPTLGMADGYAIQRELVPMLLADGDRIVGYKVGVTSKAMQRMIGIDSPDYGPVLASTVFRDGDAIPLSMFIQPKVEAEIVLYWASGCAGLASVLSTPARRPPVLLRRWRSSTLAFVETAEAPA